MFIWLSFCHFLGKVESCLDEEFQIMEGLSLPW